MATNDPKIPLSQVYRLFKKFVTEEVHECDYSQGQTLNDTILLLKDGGLKEKEY